MKAAIYRRYGPPEMVQLEDVAKPVPKDNEILVRVHATTVCATDSRVRKADYFIFRLFIGLSKPRKPLIAGVEFSGRVVQVGKDVSRFKVGDLVFGWPGRGKGRHVEYICMPEFGAVELKPANMSLDEAASIFCGCDGVGLSEKGEDRGRAERAYLRRIRRRRRIRGSTCQTF